MSKISLVFKKLQTSWANNSAILKIKNAKFLWYCFCKNTNIQGDFQICISAPLTWKRVQKFSKKYGGWGSSKFSIFQTKYLVSWKQKSFV